MDAQTWTYLIALFGMAVMYHVLLRGQRKRNAQLFDMVDRLAQERDALYFTLLTAQQDSAKLRQSLAALQRQLDQH